MKNKKKILFVAPPLAGHTFQLIVLASELASRGFTTAFANEESFRERIVRNGIKFLSWEPRNAIQDTELLKHWDHIWEKVSREPHILRGERMMWSLAAELYVPMFRTLAPIFEQFAPDLVVVDSGAFPAMDLAHQRGIPYIILAQFIGPHVSISPKYPQYGTPFSIHMTTREKLLNRLQPLLALRYMGPCIARLNQFRKSCSVHVDWKELYYKNLMMVSTVFGIEQPRPLPPLIQMIGPLVPAVGESLPVALKKWLDTDAEHNDVVYVSCGTLATLESWQAKALIEGVSSAGARILLALRKSQHSILPPLPSGLRLETFAPQQAVLSHPAVRAFVSHCGMNSVSESLYHGKPILCLPIFGDQHYNAARVADLGAGLKLNKQRFDADEVREKIGALLKEQRYSDAARRVSAVLQHTRGRYRAADLVETVLEAGLGHLIPQSLNAGPGCGHP